MLILLQRRQRHQQRLYRCWYCCYCLFLLLLLANRLISRSLGRSVVRSVSCFIYLFSFLSGCCCCYVCCLEHFYNILYIDNCFCLGFNVCVCMSYFVCPPFVCYPFGWLFVCLSVRLLVLNAWFVSVDKVEVHFEHRTEQNCAVQSRTILLAVINYERRRFIVCLVAAKVFGYYFFALFLFLVQTIVFHNFLLPKYLHISCGKWCCFKKT